MSIFNSFRKIFSKIEILKVNEEVEVKESYGEGFENDVIESMTKIEHYFSKFLEDAVLKEAALNKRRWANKDDLLKVMTSIIFTLHPNNENKVYEPSRKR